MTITEFLLARIAEREALARAVMERAQVSAHWRMAREDRYTGREVVDENQRPVVREDDGGVELEIAEFIAANDPAYVLAECEAKRRIVELHSVLFPPIGPPIDEEDEDLVCKTCEDRWRHDAEPWPCPTLRALASVYADRPGFDTRWAV